MSRVRSDIPIYAFTRQLGGPLSRVTLYPRIYPVAYDVTDKDREAFYFSSFRYLPDPVLQQVQDDTASQLAAMQDAIYLNAKLFQRVSKIYAERHTLHLTPEGLRLVEYDYQEFFGAFLGRRTSPTPTKQQYENCNQVRT